MYLVQFLFAFSHQVATFLMHYTMDYEATQIKDSQSATNL